MCEGNLIIYYNEKEIGHLIYAHDGIAIGGCQPFA